ncbi:hypothetical protein GCM10009809_29230 [Isoptericola hypogeus]|uniref:ABC3 transporter permease C-terminal domain-containing protein n=1 Tax=Isoptericola hypogeus TaxID=300179 RepID=A0ABP4VQJ8_9MICO
MSARSSAFGRFRGRWRVALRYGWRDARRNKGRTALVAVMVVLPVALGSFAATVLWSARDTPESIAQRALGTQMQAHLAYDSPGVEQQPDALGWGGTGEETEPRPREDVEADLAAALPGGDRLVPVVRASTEVHAGGLQLDGEAMQADLSDPALMVSFTLAEGTSPAEGEVALSTTTADQLGVGIGDTVEVAISPMSGAPDIEPTSAQVAGLLDGPQPQRVEVLFPASGPLAAPAELPSSQDTWVQWFVAGDSPVTWDDVLALNEVGAVVTSRDVLLDPPPDEDVPYYGGLPAGGTTSDLVQQWTPFAAVVAVALLEVVLLIGPAFAVGARRSARSLALIAATGGTTRALRAVVLGTGVVIGAASALVGTVIGVVAGVVAVNAASDNVPVVPWLPVLGILLVGVGIAASAAWLPARGASKADVVAVLAGRRGDVAYRRWPAVVGTVLGLGGFAGAVVAAVAGQALLLAAGVVVGELGLVLACGGIVALLGRLARHLPLSWRFALRDAARHRARTAPALAAVLIAVAGASGGLVYSSSQSTFDVRSQTLAAAPGALTVAVSDLAGTTALSDRQVDRIEELVREVVPDAGELHPVTALRDTQGSVTTSSWAVPPPDHEFSSAYGAEVGSIVGPIVDDGALLELLGVPEPEAAREALRDGRAVVLAGDVWDDGTTHLNVSSRDSESEEELENRTVTLPATGVGDPLGPTYTGLPVVPPNLVDESGVGTSVIGVIGMPGTPPSDAELQTLQGALDEEFGAGEWGTCQVCAGVGQPVQDIGAPQWLSTLLIVGSAGVLALAAAWIAAALAATESRPDLATLAAVGAAPTTRKRIVAAQAGTIVVIGSVLGAVSGIALGAAFVLFERYRYDVPDLRWTVEIPWPVLAALVVVLPLLAVAAAWLVTRSRLVLTRRLAG